MFQVPRDRRLLPVNKVSDNQEDQEKRYNISKSVSLSFCVYSMCDGRFYLKIKIKLAKFLKNQTGSVGNFRRQ